MSSLAIIPARGGSKRIPKKNIKLFCGKPIIAYSIETALKSNLFDEVMVSTDDNNIVDIAKQYGATIPFMRSKENADDYSGLSDVCIEVLRAYEKINKTFAYVCCILPTAPFINKEILINARKIIDKGIYNCVFPVVEYSYPIQRSLKIDQSFVSMRWPENFSKRSQDLEKTYHDAGQFYFGKTESLLREGKFFTQQSGAIILREREVQDIDTEEDWILAEYKYKFIKEISRNE